MSEQTCETCMYCQRFDGPFDPDDVIIGVCRRFPPVVIEATLTDSAAVLGQSMYAGVWPNVASCDWCGEWKPRLADAAS